MAFVAKIFGKSFKMGFTRELVRWIEKSSSVDVHYKLAKLLFKDWYGCTVAGLEELSTKRLQASYGRIGRSSSQLLSPQEQAFVFGFAAHCLELDDSEFFGETHPSAAVFSALLAQCPPDRNLQDVLASAVVGFFSLVPIGINMNPSHYAAGWHGTGPVGALAATVACSHLNRLTKEQTEAALGIAMTLLSGTQSSFGTDSKYLNSGSAARAAVVAVSSVQAGLTGAGCIFERRGGIFEMFSGAPIQNYSFPDWTQMSLEFIKNKPFPLCHCLLPVIASLNGVIQSRKVVHTDVVSVHLKLSQYSREILIFDRPKNKNEAFFSAPYVLSTVLLHPKVQIKNFFAFVDEFAHQGHDKPNIQIETDVKLQFMDHGLEIVTKQGEKFGGTFQFDRGFSWQERGFIHEKFIQLVRPLARNEFIFSELTNIFEQDIENLTVGEFFELSHRNFGQTIWLASLD
jgi:2-methylcitrate dehydratase PrpD